MSTTSATMLGVVDTSLAIVGSDVLTIVMSRLAINAPTETQAMNKNCLFLSVISYRCMILFNSNAGGLFANLFYKLGRFDDTEIIAQIHRHDTQEK